MFRKLRKLAWVLSDFLECALTETQSKLETIKCEQTVGCEYCLPQCGPKPPSPPLDWQYGLNDILPDYKFCPMCGRKMR